MNHFLVFNEKEFFSASQYSDNIQDLTSIITHMSYLKFILFIEEDLCKAIKMLSFIVFFSSFML